LYIEFFSVFVSVGSFDNGSEVPTPVGGWLIVATRGSQLGWLIVNG
jgi:hypothetical protein